MQLLWYFISHFHGRRQTGWLVPSIKYTSLWLRLCKRYPKIQTTPGHIYQRCVYLNSIVMDKHFNTFQYNIEIANVYQLGSNTWRSRLWSTALGVYMSSNHSLGIKLLTRTHSFIRQENIGKKKNNNTVFLIGCYGINNSLMLIHAKYLNPD